MPWSIHVLILGLFCMALPAAEAKPGKERGRGKDDPRVEYREQLERQAASGMRWRCYADYGAGIAFRHPYRLRPADLYKPELHDGLRLVVAPQVVVEGRKIDLSKELGALRPQAAVRCFTYTAAELPEAVRKGGLAAVGDHVAGTSLAWRDWDYYRSDPTRPFAARTWAPSGISARLGQGAQVCVLAVQHGGRWSGLVLRGQADEPDLARMLDSFEVMKGGERNGQTWLEAQTLAGRIPDSAAGRPDRGWKDNWEIETRHYHVTGHQSPQRLLQHGANLEALYEAYRKFFDAKRMPAFKAEVHIFNDQATFRELAAAWGCVLPNEKGDSLGGFFAPALLSLWLREDSILDGGPEARIEHVMSHECSHQFLHLVCNGSDHVPTWIDEGVAVYFENGNLTGGRYEWRSPDERVRLLQAIYRQKKGVLQPLDVYINHRGSIPGTHYSEVYAMLHFWAFGVPGGRERFLRYWAELKERKDGAEAFERIFMADMVKSQGSREKAIRKWQEMLVAYVLAGLKS